MTKRCRVSHSDFMSWYCVPGERTETKKTARLCCS